MTGKNNRTSFGARFLDRLEGVVSWAVGLALICVALTIFFNASGRYLTGWSFLGGGELARLLTVWITFVGAFALVRHERHVNIDLVMRAVSPKIQRILRSMIDVIGMAVMTYIIWNSYNLTAFSFGTGQMGTTLPVLRSLFFLAVLIGAILMFIAFAEVLIRSVTNTLRSLAAAWV